MGRLIAISHVQVRRRRPVTTGRPDQSWTAVPHHSREPTSDALFPTQMTTLNPLTSRLCLVKNHKTPSTMIATL
ncbi:hypothetical protein [Arcanobacterium canis]